MIRFSSLLILSFLSVLPLAKADVSTVNIALDEAYVPIGFDSNDRVQFVADGMLSNTCFKLAPHEVHVDQASKVISLTARAYKYPGVCLDMIIPFNFVVEPGMMAAGKYRVIDGSNKAQLDILPVKQSRTDQVDDFLYAPVEDAVIDPSSNTVALTGSFSQDCYQFKKVDVSLNNRNVVLVVPVIEKIKSSCQAKRVPFKEVRSLPNMFRGRSLLHVRSLNGNSINKLFDIGE